MNIGIEIDMSDIEELNLPMKRAAEDAMFMARASEVMKASVQGIIDQGGFASVQPDTLRREKGRVGDLHWSGDLRREIDAKSRATGATPRPGAAAMSIKNQSPGWYIRVLFKGGGRTKQERKMFRWAGGLVDKIQKSYANYLETGKVDL